MDKTPTPVSRGALERVFARAAELQAGKGDAGEVLSDAQIVEIGTEVGLSPENLRRALAEERARGGSVEEKDSLIMTLIGGRTVSAQRAVPGAPDTVMAALDRWMQNEEWLRVKRQQADRMVWEPRRDLIGGLRRAFGGKSHALHSTTDVAATVVALEPNRSLVALTADLTQARTNYLTHVGVWTGVSAAATGALSIMGFMTIVAILPVALVGPLFVFGAQRAMAGSLTRAQLALEQVLDRLEQRQPETRPPSLLQMIDSALPRLR